MKYSLAKGADGKDVAPLFQQAYPKATFALIAARAYVASRCLDFILAHWTNVIADQIAVSGHSRNGKQSLVFAAMDERVTAVVGSSPGAPIAAPYRFTSSNFYGEGRDEKNSRTLLGGGREKVEVVRTKHVQLSLR